jgi:hypothetical protein
VKIDYENGLNFKKRRTYISLSLRHPHSGTESDFIFLTTFLSVIISGDIPGIYILTSSAAIHSKSPNWKSALLKTDYSRASQQRFWKKFPAPCLSLGWIGSNILLVPKCRHCNGTWERERGREGHAANSINALVPVLTLVGCRTLEKLALTAVEPGTLRGGVRYAVCFLLLFLNPVSNFANWILNWKFVNTFLRRKYRRSKSKLLYDCQSVSQSVSQSICLGIEYPCGTCNQILLPVGMLLSEICGLVSIGRPLWREDGSAICSVITQ